jgi:hypothetical protein
MFSMSKMMSSLLFDFAFKYAETKKTDITKKTTTMNNILSELAL